MDLMYVDGDVYLVSVSIPMDMAMVNHVAKEKKGSLKSRDKLIENRERPTITILLKGIQHRQDTMR
jgi:hypothetical protein